MPVSISMNPVALQQVCLSNGNKRRLLFLIIGGLFILLQGCATTPPMSPGEEARTQARTAYLANDYQRTLAIVRPRAEAGEAWAQYTLGYMLHYGRGMAADRQIAKVWIQRAAEQGYAPAQEALRRISLPPSKMEEEMDSTPKPTPPGTQDNTAPSPPASEQKQEQNPPSPQTKSPTSSAEPPIAPSPNPAATAEPADSTSQASQTLSQAIAPAAPAAETTPPVANPPTAEQETISKPLAEPAGEAASSSPPSPPPPPTIPLPVTPPAGTTDHPPPSSSLNKGIKGSDWISKQDPQHFTVQLISSIDESEVIRLIRKHGIEPEAAYYSTMHGGQLWYVLVYGSFPNRNAARQALKQLPPSLRRDSPRIRTFDEIHALLNTAP